MSYFFPFWPKEEVWVAGRHTDRSLTVSVLQYQCGELSDGTIPSFAKIDHLPYNS
jgi:hypothetical protein